MSKQARPVVAGAPEAPTPGVRRSQRHRPLTVLQERFCCEFLRTGNLNQAVRDAGYRTRSPNVIAYHLMRNPVIQARIQAVRAAMIEKSRASTEYVLGHIVRSIERSVRGTPITTAAGVAVTVLDELGNSIPVLRVNERALLRGCELLGRFLGMGSKLELTGKDGAALFPAESESSMLERARRIAFAMGRGLMLIQGGKPGLPAPVSVLHPTSKAGEA